MIKIFSDGGARGNPGHAASAYVIYDSEEVISQNSKYLGIATNNVAEYSGVILALEALLEMNLKDDEVSFRMDSELVVKQLTGVYRIKNADLMDLSIKVKKLLNTLLETKNLKITFTHVPRSQNALADKLVNENLDDSSRL
jgi:ribonuclease HI